MRYPTNGRPPTGASALGKSTTTGRSLVPSPPTRMSAATGRMRRTRPVSDVAERRAAQHPIPLQQLDDAMVEASPRFEARLPQALVGHDVVALVRIAPDRRIVDIKVGHASLHLLGELLLGQVRIVQAQV